MSALITLLLLAAIAIGILERRDEQPAEIRVQLIDVQFPPEPGDDESTSEPQP